MKNCTVTEKQSITCNEQLAAVANEAGDQILYIMLIIAQEGNTIKLQPLHLQQHLNLCRYIMSISETIYSKLLCVCITG